MSSSTKGSRHWQIIRQNMSNIIKMQPSDGILKKSSEKETPTWLPNQIIDVYPEHLPVTNFVNLAIQITASQEHDVSKIELKPKTKLKKIDVYDVDKDIQQMIHLFCSLVGIILFLCGIVGCIILSNVLKSDEPIPCIDDVVSDGVCDDRQNIPECNYDEDDCCLIPRIMSFCEDCHCYF